MKTINEYAEEMKRDWNERAYLNAKWYINNYKHEQTEEEFDNSCVEDVHHNILLALPALTWKRPPRQLRLLEIGCGIGRMSRQLADIFGELHGVDVSGEMIRQARERLQDVPNAHFYETSGVDFAVFPDSHFDVIFSAYVFQHIPTPAAIASNIRDAYRVLAPGGVFKFVSSSVRNAEFDAMPKTTWTGAAFTESDVRTEARALGAQIISIVGDGSQYCWSLLRKPNAHATQATEALRIVAAGRADDLTISEIPSRGEYAILGLLVTGLASDEVNCEQLCLEWPSAVNHPSYAGPQGATLATALAGNYDAAAIFQLNVRVPVEVASGAINVCVSLTDGRRSEPVTINLLPPTEPPPKIVQSGNAYDDGVDIYTSGPKSMMRLLVARLADGVQPAETQIHCAGVTIQPQAIAYLPANGIWELKARVPVGTPAQEIEISVSYQGRESDKVSVTIKA